MSRCSPGCAPAANVVPVLEAAAVIGRQMDRGLLCAVVDLSDDEVDDVIDELEDALVLEPCGTDGWRFRHELLREVAAELAPPSVRTAMHARVADALVGVGGDPDWPLVAAHYERAERFDEAASAYQQASADCPSSRRASRGPQLPDPGPRAARPRDTRPATATAARWPYAWNGDSLPRPRKASKIASLSPTSSGACSWAAPTCATIELFATLVALTGYYAGHADVHRLAQVLEPLRAGVEEGRQWFRPVTDVMFGVLAWLRGEFDTAGSHFEQATADLATADLNRIDAVWFVPSEPITTAHVHLGWTRLVRGDLAGAEAELAQAARRADELGFPQGPLMHAYTRFFESWICIETGQLDRAAVAAADMSRSGRAARFRPLAAGGGHPAGHRQRPGRTRRRPRPDAGWHLTSRP